MFRKRELCLKIRFCLKIKPQERGIVYEAGYLKWIKNPFNKQTLLWFLNA
jgi:hypothetical protein